MTTKLKRKHAKKRKSGGIRKHKFAVCAKQCRGNRNCMSTCLKR